MRRSFAVLTLISLTALPGCLNVQDKEEREPWSKGQWKDELRANELRLKSEDQLPKAAWKKPIAKVTDKIWDQITRIYNYITGTTPFNAAKDLLDPTHADRRRQAIVYLSKREFGRQDPYVTYYAEMVRSDRDYTVRAMAIRALNRVRAQKYSPLYLQFLEDRHELVRLEAAKALANVPDARAIQALMNHLEPAREESIDVRVACVDALRNYRTSEVAQALVRALGDRQLGVCFQARRSLKVMTGKDYRYDQAAWLNYLTSNSKPFLG